MKALSLKADNHLYKRVSSQHLNCSDGLVVSVDISIYSVYIYSIVIFLCFFCQPVTVSSRPFCLSLILRFVDVTFYDK